MNGKTRILAVLAIAGLVASFALPALGQQRRDWWSGARSFRRPSPSPRPPGRPSPGERSPGEHEKPRPMVFQFKHISVESFAETLKQLGSKNEDLAKVLGGIPMAVNEEANAITIIAPPEVIDGLAQIAHGLDRPNEYRVHLQEMEMRERRIQAEIKAMERGGERPRPPFPPHGMSRGYSPHGMSREHSGHSWRSPFSRYRSAHRAPSQHHRGSWLGRYIRARIERYRAGRRPEPPKPPVSSWRERIERYRAGRRPEPPKPPARSAGSSFRDRIERYRAGRRPEPPKPPARPSASTSRSRFMPGMKVMALTSPAVAGRLELSDEQVKRIRGLFSDYAAGVRQLYARVRHAIEDVPSEQRRAKYGELRSKVEAELAKRVKALNTKVLGLMAGEQRQGAAKILGVALDDAKPEPDARPRQKRR